MKSTNHIILSGRSQRLLNILLKENPAMDHILRNADSPDDAMSEIREWILHEFAKKKTALSFYRNEEPLRKDFEKLEWQDYGIIRLLDYLDHHGKIYSDPNLRGQEIASEPFKILWLAVKNGTGGGEPEFFMDMIRLFRQSFGKSIPEIPGKKTVLQWMDRHPSGLDPRIIEIREANRDRILKVIINKIKSGELKSNRFCFKENMNRDEKFKLAMEWWNDHRFHLRFAVRSPDMLNELLNYSLDADTMKILKDAERAGIPFFVNPYYLSLLNVEQPEFATGCDLAIRQYVIYSRQLIEEFGHISAWEMEDIVEPGKPNAAGWILPTAHNIHRRYPDVAILIPDSMGRACGGLCASCQRMYDFQNGHLNFNLKKLLPNEKWEDKLTRLLDYFEQDSQLRDILITGGDALMSSDKTLKNLLEAVCEMAARKKARNRNRGKTGKLAEIVRVRLGTRLPVYLPHRITPELVNVLRDFKKRANKAGIKQLVIQTHFESPMEITPPAKKAIQRLQSAGWIVTNQLVLTSAASRRGHTAKLRQVLNRVGVLPYYTFTVKGYMENYSNFAPNARSVQEQMEEKKAGKLTPEHYKKLQEIYDEPENIVDTLREFCSQEGLPFLATDRNVLNLPGVGKSMSFRVIGITHDGRRILRFDHDRSRAHSPVIHRMGKVIIIESKPIDTYIRQLEEMGEDREEYNGVFGYSAGQTEPRMPIYEYPDYAFDVTPELTNFEAATLAV